jgi:hypothetical protein
VDRALEEAPTAPLLDARYRLGPIIGKGGMGEVYRAEDIVLGRTVAVKVVQPAAGVSNASERVRNEVSLLAAVQHPSLVTLLDARIEDGGSSYLVMEFVDGPSLAQHMRRGPLTEIEVATLAVDLASGLEAVHTAGVVHRDLTPSNVLLASSALSRVPFHAKLADFGVAFLIDSTRLTTPGMVVGTAAYLAPEQVRGDAAAPPADIYALGLVLLESLTGQRAYPHASGIGAVMARLVEPPKIPSGVGAEWSALLTRMTSSDPAERPTAREVATIATELRKSAKPAPMVEAAPAPVVAAVDQPTQAMPAAPVVPAVSVAPAANAAVLAPTQAMPRTIAPRPVAGSGERASLRRTRVRSQRKRRAVVLVGSAALIAGLAIPAGLWATAGHTEEPGLVVTEPEVDAPSSLVTTDDSSGGDIVPAGSTSSTEDSQDAEKQQRALDTQTEEQAREQQKAQDAAAREQAKAERDAADAAEKAARDTAKAERGTGQRDR